MLFSSKNVLIIWRTFINIFKTYNSFEKQNQTMWYKNQKNVTASRQYFLCCLQIIKKNHCFLNKNSQAGIWHSCPLVFLFVLGMQVVTNKLFLLRFVSLTRFSSLYHPFVLYSSKCTRLALVYLYKFKSLKIVLHLEIISY